MLTLMTNHVLRGKAEEIRKSSFIAIGADECSDISNKEQLVITITWTNESLDIMEDVLGLYGLEKTDATSITNAILDVFRRMNISINNVRALYFDGASNMAGEKSGVAARLKSLISPEPIYIHCYGHSLNLAMGDTINNNQPLKNVFATVQEITKLLKKSPKRDAAFKKIQASYPGIYELKLLVLF